MFGLLQRLPSERCFLCWYPATNLIFLFCLLTGNLWMLTKSMDQEGDTEGALDVEILFFSSHRVIFILRPSNDSLEDSPHPRVFPYVECVAGKNSVASCSFWNEFGRISRLTGVNVITLQTWPDHIRLLHATAHWHMCPLRVWSRAMLWSNTLQRPQIESSLFLFFLFFPISSPWIALWNVATPVTGSPSTGPMVRSSLVTCPY